MSRDDPIPTHRVELGECDCPTKPHAEGDYALVRDRLDYGGIASVLEFGDTEAFFLNLFATSIDEWNLVTWMDEIGKDGKVTKVLTSLPVTRATVNRLSNAQHLALLADANAAATVVGVRVPNSQGGPSQDGTAGNRQQRRSARKTATR